MVTTTGSLFGASIGLLLPAVWFWPSEPPSLQAWLSLLILGLFCTALAYVMYFRLMTRNGPATAMTVTYLIPVFANCIGVVWLDEIVTPWMLGCGVLAYSTMSQLGYMTMIIFSFHENMEWTTILQLIAHAVAKINLFFCAGIFYLKYKIKKISDMNSLAKKEFILCLCFAICALSIIGLPPTIGFISKFNMLVYAMKNQEFFIIFVLSIGTILNCYYFLPIISRMFFEKRLSKESENRELVEYESHFTLYVPIYISAISVIVLFCMLI